MNKQLALVGLSALALVLGGCGHKASGQAVAVVNGEEISSSELNDEISAANLPPDVDKKAITSQLLQNIVDRHILVQKAEADGLDKSPEFIGKLRRLREQLLLQMLSDRQSGSAKLPDQAAIDQFIAGNPQMFANRSVWTLDQLQFDAPKDQGVIAKLKDTHSLDQIAAVLTAANVPYVKAQPKVDTGNLPAQLVAKINALPPTEPFIMPAGGKVFASVITSRQPAPAVSADEQRKIALQLVRRQNANEAMAAQLKTLKTTAKIEYQPGYAPAPAKPGAKPAN
jgi:peptidyl-prolyl cis-trans isomerase C